MPTKKELLTIAFMAVTAGLMFYLNPIQPTEVNMKLSILCSENPEIPCEEIIAYCEDALYKAGECYLIN